LRNQEAARYARWAAMSAGLIALIVVGVYVRRAVREARARRSAPPSVPSTVQQKSAAFSFSKVEQDRTLFTVRASQATQFKDQNRSLLEDVWVTIYGREGNRNDNIHTRECSYEPKTGNIRCEGEVQIDLQGASPAPGKPPEKSLEVKTRNLTFNRETGVASTTDSVDFHFPNGQGHGVGLTYESTDAIVRLGNSVQIDLLPSERSGGLPVAAAGSSLEIRRNQHVAVLDGPATVKQGNRELAAEKISIELDADFRARHAVASGHPSVRIGEENATLTVSSAALEAFLDPAGWIERIVADGHVTGERVSPTGTDHFSAARSEFNMQPQKNVVREMLATGEVTGDSRQGANSRSLKTDSLRVEFGTAQQADQQRILSAETLAPAMIETKTGQESTTLHAPKFVAQFGSTGRLDKLFGHSGVQIRRQFGSAPPQVTSAAELAATFGPDGQWETLDETGNVRFQQSDRQAASARASVVASTGTITMEGSPVLSDSSSRTTASGVNINQNTGEIHAAGNVISTYLSAQDNSVSLGSGPAHISADTLTGSSKSGDATYMGHARLWQGESVLDAEQIEIWRDEKKMRATGSVVAVFPQASTQAGTPPSQPVGHSSGPTLWEIHAPSLIYWSDLGKAHLEGGVTANSQQGSLTSQKMDVFLGPSALTQGTSGATSSRPPGAKAASSTPSDTSGGAAGASGGRQLSRVLAQGDVMVWQADRQGTAEQAEYTAADGRFVLSGGQPTLTDAARDTTTGHSLTFFVANDTILVDSQEGSRTLTKHRVEK
jgi:lipopolysaccharide export system protein LptA